MRVLPLPVVVLLVGLLAGCGRGAAAPARSGAPRPADSGPSSATTASPAGTAAPAPPPPFSVRVRAVGHLPSPVQDPATTGLASGEAVLFGGLDQADASVDAIVRIRNDRARPAGRLTAVMHDMAATSIGDRAYAFGGGNLGSSDEILREGTEKVGTLPTAASDVTATTVGGTAYIVGGYDGANPLDTIVAWRPGRHARVVAHLPRPLRYAAVAAVAGHVLIAGGTSGTSARREVLSFDPARGVIRTIGRLPAVVTHAGGAALAGRFLIIGGRRDALQSQTSAIVAVTPASGRSRPAGRLPRPLSDAGAATLGSQVLVAGGRDDAGVVHDAIYRLRTR